MKKNVVKIDGKVERAAIVLRLPPNNVEAAVFFEHQFRETCVPHALTRRPRSRHVTKCTIVTVPRGDILGVGMSYCRPPDPFNSKVGATIAFRRAVDQFCSSSRFRNYYGPEFDVRRILWTEFTKRKAWKRVEYVKTGKSEDKQQH